MFFVDTLSTSALARQAVANDIDPDDNYERAYDGPSPDEKLANSEALYDLGSEDASQQATRRMTLRLEGGDRPVQSQAVYDLGAGDDAMLDEAEA